MYERAGGAGTGAPSDAGRWCAISTNVIGGCRGSTGPSSLAPDGKAWGSRFPTTTVRDQVAADVAALHRLGITEVAAVIEDRRIKAVTLTGSEPAGRSVASTAGHQIKKAVLELGGSDPFIVMPSADLEAAAAVAVKARISNNGQSCIAGKRFIVHADVYDQFVGLFADKMKALVVGDPMDEATEVGPLATASGRTDVAELVDDAVAKGAQLRTGGAAPDRPGWFYEPTVLAELTDDMRIVMEETFGPVASVYKAADRDEAVRIANQTTFGLSSAVWSNEEAEQDWFIANLDAGAVFLNGMTVSYPELPFGGVKDSGYGRELAAAGIREFCNLKTVWRA